MRPSFYRQKGAAVLVALFIVALAAVVATRFSYRTNLEYRKLENRATVFQARMIEHAALRWAQVILKEDARKNSVDHYGEAWSKKLPPIDSEGYKINGQLADGQSLFDLNALIDGGGKKKPKQVQVLERLLGVLRIDTTVAEQIADCLDSDLVRDSQQAESGCMLNRKLAHVRELRSRLDLDPSQFDILESYTIALPQSQSINVNTASEEILMAIHPGMSLSAARALIEERERSWFVDEADFKKRSVSGYSYQVPISVNTNYILATVQVTKDKIVVKDQALLSRLDSNEIVWRVSL